MTQHIELINIIYLVVYLNVNSAVFNVIFGIPIADNEIEETHQWCLRGFLGIHEKGQHKNGQHKTTPVQQGDNKGRTVISRIHHISQISRQSSQPSFFYVDLEKLKRSF